jgi:hypothetical protein
MNIVKMDQVMHLSLGNLFPRLLKVLKLLFLIWNPVALWKFLALGPEEHY